jgi:hypothetical protein
MEFGLVCTTAAMVFLTNAMLVMQYSQKTSVVFIAMGAMLVAMGVTAVRNDH